MEDQVSEALQQHVGSLTIDTLAAEVHDADPNDDAIANLTDRMNDLFDGLPFSTIKAACLNALITIAEEEHAGCVEAANNPLANVIQNIAGGNRTTLEEL